MSVSEVPIGHYLVPASVTTDHGVFTPTEGSGEIDPATGLVKIPLYPTSIQPKPVPEKPST